LAGVLQIAQYPIQSNPNSSIPHSSLHQIALSTPFLHALYIYIHIHNTEERVSTHLLDLLSLDEWGAWIAPLIGEKCSKKKRREEREREHSDKLEKMERGQKKP
jgi:hypothetical protein